MPGVDEGRGTEDEGRQEEPDFDSWLNERPEAERSLIDGHVRGLKSALINERESRKGLEKQLRDLATKAEKGSQAERDLTEMVNQAAEANQKAEFYELASAAGVTNLRLAFMAARADELFDKRGNPDFKALREHYPELFGAGQKTAPGNAGSGTNHKQPASQSMNDFIRVASGRKP